MNTIPERTTKIRTNLKNHFVHNSISGRQFIIRSQAKVNNDKITIMEMWENYLSFTRLEF